MKGSWSELVSHKQYFTQTNQKVETYCVTKMLQVPRRSRQCHLKWCFTRLQSSDILWGDPINHIINWYLPKTKLSGRNIWPNGPERTESIVPGSRSTRTALGTYFPPECAKKKKQQLNAQWDNQLFQRKLFFVEKNNQIINNLLPRYNKRLFFPTVSRNLHDKFLSDRYRVRPRSLPKTEMDQWMNKLKPR